MTLEATQEQLIRIAMMVHGENDAYASDLWNYVRDEVLEAVLQAIERAGADPSLGWEDSQKGLDAAYAAIAAMKGKP